MSVRETKKEILLEASEDFAGASLASSKKNSVGVRDEVRFANALWS